MKPYELFEVLARVTWHSIHRLSRNRIRLGEDAITSINLDALASAGPACVFVEDTRSQESTKGCDFELWIGSTHLGWKRYAVQAKKIEVGSGRYTALSHKVGGRPQIDILDAYAIANRALPIYCFYNYSSKAYEWNCNLPSQLEQLGCTVTPSSIVRAAIAKHGARNFTHVHSQPSTLPWRCLIRCPNFIVGAGTGPIGWPALDDCFHPSLPAPLQRLRDHGASFSFEDQAELFNSNVDLRPEWIGIVDVQSEGLDG